MSIEELINEITELIERLNRDGDATLTIRRDMTDGYWYLDAQWLSIQGLTGVQEYGTNLHLTLQNLRREVVAKAED